MGLFTLTVVDTSGIQPYVFGTNNLQQNVGASYLVDCATRGWVVKSLERLNLTHNVEDLDDVIQPFKNQSIENKSDHLNVEVVYAGGGNTVLIFDTSSHAQAFAEELSKKLLAEAPGLHLVIAHQEFLWEEEALGGSKGVVQQLMSTLSRQKAAGRLGIEPLGYGVSAACAFTGLPAVAVDETAENGRPISAESAAKFGVIENANRRLRSLFSPDRPFAFDFEDLGGEKGESSYIAVVHTDGNNMGDRVARIAETHSQPNEGNRSYILAQRNFSISIQKAAYVALSLTIKHLAASIELDEDGREHIAGKVYLKDHKYPFRPLVYGGDDVSFVCEGRLALPLAAYYLEQLSNQILTDDKPLTCRAGVAVVKLHYPFSRAYELAEQLCASSRSYIKSLNQDITVMDWHFAVSGHIHNLKEIREREYLTSCGSLTMRPIRISPGGEPSPWRSWNAFSTLVTAFDSTQLITAFDPTQKWVDRRNKVKALRLALREGPDAVRNFLVNYNAEEKDRHLPKLSTDQHQGWQKIMEESGWLPLDLVYDADKIDIHDKQVAQKQICGYFDAIEAMDFFVPLSERRSA